MFENLRNVIGLKDLYRSDEFDLIDKKYYQKLIKMIGSKNIKVLDLCREICFDRFSETRQKIVTKLVNMLIPELYLEYRKNSNIWKKIFYCFTSFDQEYYWTNTVARRGIIVMYMD